MYNFEIDIVTVMQFSYFEFFQSGVVFFNYLIARSIVRIPCEFWNFIVQRSNSKLIAIIILVYA